jgi:hypothetical protein
VLRLTSLLDEAVCGFVDLVVLGLIGSYGWGCFRPKADSCTLFLSTNPRLLEYASFLIAWHMRFCNHKLLSFTSRNYHSTEKYQGLHDGKK